MTRIIGDDVARFWSKVQKGDGCWEWNASREKAGYGSFRLGERTVKAHRYAYELVVGPIPEGLHLDHLCRNRGCVNPDHLEPVTHRTNVLRGAGVTAANARKTHCIHGHEFTPDNIVPLPGGGRKCRACQLAANLRHRAKVRERKIA